MAAVMGFLAAVDPHPCVSVTGGVESRRPSLRSSFVGAWRCRKSVSSLRRRRQGRSRRLVIVSELAGQYDENFEDVHSVMARGGDNDEGQRPATLKSASSGEGSRTFIAPMSTGNNNLGMWKFKVINAINAQDL